MLESELLVMLYYGAEGGIPVSGPGPSRPPYDRALGLEYSCNGEWTDS